MYAVEHGEWYQYGISINQYGISMDQYGISMDQYVTHLSGVKSKEPQLSTIGESYKRHVSVINAAF